MKSSGQTMPEPATGTVTEEDSAQQLAWLTRHNEICDVAHKVVHDLKSPLSALELMIESCTEVRQEKLASMKNTLAALKDIVGTLIGRISTGYGESAVQARHELVLAADFIARCISERKYQYSGTSLNLDLQVAPEAHFACLRAQPGQLARALSNLLSNAAAAALAYARRPKITVRLDSDERQVKITIQDNGSGMQQTALDKVRNRVRFTEGKANGHGLGMMQVWDMIDANAVQFEVNSSPGEGASFELSFERHAKPDWIVEQLTLNSDDIVIVVEDDQAAHDTWSRRFTALTESLSDLVVRHEKQGRAVIDYVRSLCAEDRKRVVLFCDFELLNQKLHGLQVIEACQVERAVLVTGYYANEALQKSIREAHVQILPKHLAAVVPIFCLKYDQRIELVIPNRATRDTNTNCAPVFI